MCGPIWNRKSSLKALPGSRGQRHSPSDAGIERRTVSNYFNTGVYRSLRPKRPLDSPDEQSDIGLESLVFQELRAVRNLVWRGGENTYTIFKINYLS